MNRWAWLSLAAIALIAATTLAVPYYGDQALFSVMGERMTRGDVLYVDLWDPKQPATFLFYALGGRLFGFGEVGMHTFELVYWLGFAISVLLLTRNTYRQRFTPAAVVLLSVGTYYLSVRQSWIGQTEGLVAFPLFLTMWFVHEPPKPRLGSTGRLLLAGVFSGIVLLFKLIFAPIVIAFWVVAVRRSAGPDRAGRGAWPAVGRLMLGAAVPAVILSIYLLANGAFDEFFWTSFGYPIEALAVPDALQPVSVLVQSTGSFVLSYTLTGALALIGLWRFQQEPSPRRDLAFLSILWLAFGSVVILAQRTAWWSYHFLLLFVPLALIAGYGVDVVADWWPNAAPGKRSAAAMVGIALLMPGVTNLVERTVPLVANGFAISGADRSAYRAEIDPDYARRAEFGAFLNEPGATAGPIYVFGDPLYQYFSDRESASAIHGWATEFWSDRLWADVLADLTRELPPFVLTALAEGVPELRPETLAFLDDRYVTLKQDPVLGTWYALR